MITWHTSETQNDLVTELCYLSETDVRPGAQNMSARDFCDKPHTVLYKLHHEKLYDTGGYGVWSESGKPMAGGGWHQMPWHANIYYIGNRSYTLPGRNQTLPQNQLWEAQYTHSKMSGAKIVLGSFNHYNHDIIERAIRLNDPLNHARSFRLNGEWYREPGRLILPLKTLDHSVEIAHTQQWIFYHVIDPTFEAEFLDICKNNKFGR